MTEPLPWVVHGQNEMTLWYIRRNAGDYVGGKPPRTSLCPRCAEVGVKRNKVWVHVERVTFNSKNEPKAEEVTACKAPSPLSTKQRDVLRSALTQGLAGLHQPTVHELARMKLIDRNGITFLGRLRAEHEELVP